MKLRVKFIMHIYKSLLHIYSFRSIMDTKLKRCFLSRFLYFKKPLNVFML